MKQRLIADGDLCPLDESHGHMYVARKGTHQRCPHVAHDGKRDVPSTRTHWPFIPASEFRLAVEEHMKGVTDV